MLLDMWKFREPIFLPPQYFYSLPNVLTKNTLYLSKNKKDERNIIN
jgi:hypothetical protein